MEQFEAEKAELDSPPTKTNPLNTNTEDPEGDTNVADRDIEEIMGDVEDQDTEDTKGDTKIADRDVEEIKGEAEEEQISLVSSLEVEIVFNHQLLILNIFNCSCFFEFNMLFSKLFYSNT